MTQKLVLQHLFAHSNYIFYLGYFQVVFLQKKQNFSDILFSLVQNALCILFLHIFPNFSFLF